MNRKKRKALGQHFLKNPRIINKIIQIINPEKDELIIEIGPGKGALTVALDEKAGKVIAMEKDPGLNLYLQKLRLRNTVILFSDALKVSFSKLIDDEKDKLNKVKIVGNLPYSISSPILFKTYSEKEKLPFWVFLLQEEVAERITASPGSKKYSPLSIMFNNYFIMKKELRLNPGSFSPPPKVNSTLLSFKKRKNPLYFIENEEEFLSFLKLCFKERRKTLWNNLASSNVDKERIQQAFNELRLDKNLRAEQIEMTVFVKLFQFFLDKQERIRQE